MRDTKQLTRAIMIASVLFVLIAIVNSSADAGVFRSVAADVRVSAASPATSGPNLRPGPGRSRRPQPFTQTPSWPPSFSQRAASSSPKGSAVCSPWRRGLTTPGT